MSDRADPEPARARTASWVGIDLAWSTGTSGLAVLDADGRLLDVAAAGPDDEVDAVLAAWSEAYAPPRVVAVDAPLVVPNDTGSRLGERELGRAYAAFGASPYASSRMFLCGEPRAAGLAERHGWTVDPDAPLGEATVCLEVYPHPALVGLFELPYRLAYKKGLAAERRAGFARLVALLESLPTLRAPAYEGWAAMRRLALDPGPGDLDRVEDRLDAVLCAHLAWLWEHRRAALQVYGSLDEGYVVAPPPPSWPATRPPRRRP